MLCKIPGVGSFELNGVKAIINDSNDSNVLKVKIVYQDKTEVVLSNVDLATVEKAYATCKDDDNKESRRILGFP